MANVEDDPQANIKVGNDGYATMHEYGHYLQSQKYGPLFMFKVGAVSALGYDTFWTDTDANNRAKDHFESESDFVWNENKDDRYTWLHSHKVKSQWFEYACFFIGTPNSLATIVLLNWYSPYMYNDDEMDKY